MLREAREAICDISEVRFGAVPGSIAYSYCRVFSGGRTG